MKRCRAYSTLAVLAPMAVWLSAAPLSHAASDVVLTDYIFLDSFESSDCSTIVACPVPTSGKACVSGQLSETGTAAPLRAVFNRGLACGQGAVGGPCDLALAVYDAASFAANPAASPPLSNTGQTLDGCGRFRFEDIPPPAAETVAIAVDDAPGSGVNDYVPTATFHSLAPNARVDGLATPATLQSTANDWTTTAGTNLITAGVLLLTYRASDVPQPNVTVAKNGGPSPPKDYYFDDVGATRYTIAGFLSATSANGSALFSNGGLGTYSGIGGPMGCVWPQVVAASIAGIVAFVEIQC